MSDDAGPRRILVADDQALHRNMIERAIRSAGIDPPPTILEAVDGREALEALRGGVDMAFLDIRMPDMTGIEVLEAVRSDAGQVTIPIIMVSSSSDPRDVESATRLGIAAYIEKVRYPDFRKRVVETIRGILEDKPQQPEGREGAH